MTRRLLAGLGVALWLLAGAAAESSAAPTQTLVTTPPGVAKKKTQPPAPAQPAPTKPAAAPAKPAPAPAQPIAAPTAPSAPPAAAAAPAEQITLSADTTQGFARIQFRWPAPVTYDASIGDGILVITFARPFKLSPAQGRLALDDYVSIIRQDPDGKTLRLSLTRKLRLHASAGGPLVAIDLVPSSFAGDPPDVVDPTAKPPGPNGAAQVALSIVVGQDKSELVFDWGETVNYEANVADGKIEASFAREGIIDVKRLNRNPPAWVKAARVSAGDNKTLLEIDIDPGSKVEHHRAKSKIVFDVMAPVNDPDVPHVELPEGLQPSVDVDPKEPVKTADDKPAAPPPPGSDAAPIVPKPKPPVAPPPDAAKAPAAEAPPANAPAFAVTRNRDQITLTLPALASQAAAMFKRGDTVFIVIDGAGPIDPSSIAAANKDVVASANLAKDGSVSVLTLALLKPFALSAVQAKGAWNAVLSPNPLNPPRPIALLRDDRAVGGERVRATLDRARRIVTLKDPASGEAVFAALADGEPQGLLGARRYVDFAADVTAQGFIVRPLTDDLVLTPEDHDVVVSDPAGLTLSAGTAADYDPDRTPISDTQYPAAMDFAAWTGKGSFLAERSHLLNAIDPTGKATEPGRIALARFYLAHDLGAEALGELQFVVHEDQSVAGDPSFHALRGAALLQLQREKEAMDDLVIAGLDDDPNAQLFRAAAAVKLKQWDAARDDAVKGESVIAAYRPDWQARFRIAGARGALETNAIDIAERMLAAIPKDGVPQPLVLEAQLVRSQLDERLKREASALAGYDKIIQSGYRPLVARATLASISLKVAMGKMKPPEAIDALDHLRWQWRGDDVELGTLHKLGSFQIAGGDYRNGLQTLRAASLGFPKDDESRQIGAEMQGLFEDLFLNGKADSLPAVQAVGLYYDFKELTPIGAQGDDMVRKLADRLIAVDLLDQAEELLQHQVDKRLDGVAKAQIAAKLAAVYLMDRKPQKALTALRASAQTRLPDDLAAQRRLLTGRALSDLKQYDAALEAFEQDQTPEALRLRADVEWAGSRWPEAAAAIEVLIAGRDKEMRALDAGERCDVLRAAVAYTLASDDKGLASLRDRFVTLMANAPEAAAFDVVTRTVDPSAVEFRDVAKAIAGIDTLDAFLRSLGLGKPANGQASR